ncbi:MBL fold metallo-hydrolase [Campylobacter sp. MIT 21-1685]|uniref:MBL fold metallo-hydrolase n=1 Tax=unclassified Campylobacter TaxID=2593542 RepID=UPI00224B3135|nr:MULTISPECIES: MBL fold metallo-hydrolase [unclassified Campylobacter]MCX2683518.1 MBL fold metallo-hydrolase [Campylobacter sp. MIT 21-1684]MCX2751823.1 MBL fold metallo-hydrolase [Campylobacter sp. MIT 21-1682]MCX2808000.1 MBL fold metallo-hydrolase [Campylobacter sp. MIT 21-1685]
MLKRFILLCCFSVFSFANENYQTLIGENKITVISLKENKLDSKLLIAQNEEDKKRIAQISDMKANKHNVILIQNPNFTALIDTGYLDTLTKLEDALTAQGVKFKDLTHIILTHAHPDHIGAFMGQQNPFINATVLLDEKEYEYWINSQNENIRKTLEKIQKKEFFTHQTELINKNSGLKAIAAYGHTPGHNIITINDKLAFCADIFHAFDLQIQNPEISIKFDTNQQEAIQTRKHFIKEFKENEIQVIGTHMPFIQPITLNSL